jgi:hypothetical protein
MLVLLFLMCSFLQPTPSVRCPDIKDEDKRSFYDLRPIAVDVDNDGRPDAITPRVYSLKINRVLRGGKRRAKEADWIVFDLKTSKGRILNSFFRYQYGTDIADYWVYALVPCKKDGRVDLIFYSGDDTTDETVILRYKNERFVVRSRKMSKSDI